MNATTKIATVVDSKMLKSSDNQFDLFFGGESSVKWITNVTFSRGTDDSV